MASQMDDANPSSSAQSWAKAFADLRLWLTLVFFVAVLSVAWIAGSRLSGSATEPQLQAGARTGFIAPDFMLQTLDGKAMSLSAQRGNAVLINLWASWCGPCRSEMPAINNVYQKYRDAGFVVLAVNATNQDNENNARSFAAGLRLTFPVLLDREGFTGGLYRLRSLPTSYFVGRDGVIRDVVVGAMSEASLEARVKRLLAGGR